MLRTLRVGAGTPKGSLRYESASKSKSLPTLANKRRVPTEVRELLFPELFSSANNATALFFSTYLVLFTFFFSFVLKNKASSHRSGLQMIKC